MRWPVYTTGLVKTDADGQVLIKLANLDFGLTRSEELNHEGLTDEFVLEMLDAERKLVRCDFVRVELRVEQIGHHTSDRSTPKPVSVRWRPHVSPNRNVIKFNCKGMRLKGNVRLSAAIKLTAKNSQVCLILPIGSLQVVKLVVSDVWSSGIYEDIAQVFFTLETLSLTNQPTASHRVVVYNDRWVYSRYACYSHPSITPLCSFSASFCGWTYISSHPYDTVGSDMISFYL
ncbi:hypothetical protein DFH28DRAFT_1000973 [Melampsora americana]|nr:hypothetical protein DFH28DRAFT_1000973 [Melampsora americana]